jgi:alpha-beta hydrolase superfamily lysophospholipase
MTSQRRLTLLVATIVAFTTSATAQNKIQFPSLDSLTLTADVYEQGARPWIVLCHLAGHSRGEYRVTARKLSEQGFNCLALDARSGDEVLDVKNESALEAKRLGKPTSFLDAEQDIRAAVDYAYRAGGNKPVILLGSSYSASLVLKVSNHHPKIAAVIALSPGEHFGEALQLKPCLKDFDKPVLLTSSRQEAAEVQTLTASIDAEWKTQFIPTTEGAHGSIALWTHVPGHEAYWDALLRFLRSVKIN